MALSGIVVIGPQSMPLEWGIGYERVCDRLGVPARMTLTKSPNNAI